jgi:addiction module RelE/StbE family toxin
MHVQFSADFDRQFNTRLTNRQKIQVLETIDIFIDDPNHEDLRNHKLRNKWNGYRSISIGGDLRLHFRMINDDFDYFVAVGTHDQLYR